MGPNEDLDIDAMVNNPFRNIDPRLKQGKVDHAGAREPVVARPEPQPAVTNVTDRMERNHPLELRVRAIEKNEYAERMKIDDIKRIIEHQNERIRLLEEELALLRKERNGKNM